PANYFAVIVLLGHIHRVNGTHGGVLIRNVPLVFDPITLKNLFNVWKHRLEGFAADDLRDSFSDYVFRTKTKHFALRFADEPITQISAAACQHKRSSAQHSFKFFLLCSYAIGLPGAEHEKRSKQAGAEDTGGQNKPVLPGLMPSQKGGGWRLVGQLLFPDSGLERK